MDDEGSSAKRSKIEDPAVSNFREYLRIKTVQPNPDYDGAVRFLKGQAEEIGLEFNVIEVDEDRPCVVMTWRGTSPSLPSLMLNSHMDVVPVFPESWKYDPFEAYKDENGDIYARGSQDMKCCGSQYMEAVRRLKAAGKAFPRTIHLTFVPDEEVGGARGMLLFLKTDFFKNMNVGFGLDEGLASPDEVFSVYYSERLTWWVEINVSGNPGHGSRFIEDTAVEKLHKVMTNGLKFRAEQQKRFEDDADKLLGDITSLNITKINGGVQLNVVPETFTIGFDIRVTPSDVEKVEELIVQWLSELGEGTTIKWIYKSMSAPPTSTDKDDLWFGPFRDTMEKLNLKFRTEIFPAATDSRYLREVGVPAIGFSPMNHTPILLHDHNEFLNERIFLTGITIYEKLLEALCTNCK